MIKPVGITVIFAIVAGMALAHGGATGVVKNRMDAMGTLANAMKALTAEAKSTAPDAENVASLASSIAAQSGAALLKNFPAGSINGPSEARDEIWENWQRFATLATTLEAQAGTLAENAGQGAMDLTRAIQDMGGTCMACHQEFRIKK